MLLAISTTHSGTTYIIVCDTFDICTSTKEATFAGDDGEDGVWVLIEVAERRNGILDKIAAERVQGFGAIELGNVRQVRRNRDSLLEQHGT